MPRFFSGWRRKLSSALRWWTESLPAIRPPRRKHWNGRNGYRDCLMDTGELFASWIIEGPETLKQELPAAQAGLPVRFTYDHRPYRERKVRILNGAHTLMAPGAFLAGQKIVRECMQEPVIRAFLDRAVYDEILPTLSLPEEECRDFAAAVIERFQNPFIDHSLLAISLNSTSKWRTRLLPSLEGFLKTFGYLPECITASFAFYLAFCHGTKLTDKGLLSRRGKRRRLHRLRRPSRF